MIMGTKKKTFSTMVLIKRLYIKIQNEEQTGSLLPWYIILTFPPKS